MTTEKACARSSGRSSPRTSRSGTTCSRPARSSRFAAASAGWSSTRTRWPPVLLHRLRPRAGDRGRGGGGRGAQARRRRPPRGRPRPSQRRVRGARGRPLAGQGLSDSLTDYCLEIAKQWGVALGVRGDHSRQQPDDRRAPGPRVRGEEQAGRGARGGHGADTEADARLRSSPAPSRSRRTGTRPRRCRSPCSSRDRSRSRSRSRRASLSFSTALSGRRRSSCRTRSSSRRTGSGGPRTARSTRRARRPPRRTSSRGVPISSSGCTVRGASA